MTFDIVVENTGETPLVIVPVEDAFDAATLAFDSASPTPPTSMTANTLTWSDIGSIAIGDSRTISVTFTALASTMGLETNTVCASPSIAGGQQLTLMCDDAPYQIETPSFQISKTRITPANLPSLLNEPVVFELTIVNDGDVVLDPVPLTDTYDPAFLTFVNATPLTPTTTDAGTIAWDDTGSLAPGESRTVTLTFDGTGTTGTDLESNTVCSTPGVPSGGTLPEMCAEAPYQIADPGLDLIKTVYAGHNSGTSCPSQQNITDDFEQGGPDSPVTYCFEIRNTGDVPLGNFSLQDLDIGLANLTSFTYLSGDVPLQPGGTLIYYHNGNIDADLENTATVTAVPVDSFGTPIPGGAPLTDSDIAEVAIVTVSLGDYVWLDSNGDGIQDASEDGVSGVTLYLLDCSGGIPTRIDSTVTGTDGSYNFADLPPGEYAVEIDLATAPAGSALTLVDAGGDDTADSDAGPDGITPCVSLTSDGERNPTLDFGLFESVSVGNFVWNDLNFDGIQDPNEPGISGVKVDLKDAAGTTLDTAFTDAQGEYLFTDLNPGQYKVCFELPAGFNPTSTNAGPAGASSVGMTTGTNAAGGFNTMTPLTAFLANGQSDLTLDQGVIQYACVGDTVWLDLDSDGTVNENLRVNGLSGVTLELFDVADDGTRTSRGTTTTGPNGFYKFDTLEPGCYEVVVDVSTAPADLNTTTPTTQKTVVGSGEFVDSLDFGFVPIPTAISLATFDVLGNAGKATIQWTTAAESDNLGFQVYRSSTPDGDGEAVGDLVLAEGGGSTYIVEDTDLAEGTYTYWLVDLDTSFSTTVHAPATAYVGPVGTELSLIETANGNVDVVVDGSILPAVETDDGLLVYLAPGAEVELVPSASPLRIGE